jgi:hypothetical protein
VDGRVILRSMVEYLSRRSGVRANAERVSA